MDIANSYIFLQKSSPTSSSANIFMYPVESGPPLIRVWDGEPLYLDHLLNSNIPEWERAVAGDPFSVFVQLVDEFGETITHAASREAAEIFHALPYGDLNTPIYEYYGFGIYNITLSFAQAGVRSVEILADARQLQHQARRCSEVCKLRNERLVHEPLVVYALLCAHIHRVPRNGVRMQGGGRRGHGVWLSTRRWPARDARARLEASS